MPPCSRRGVPKPFPERAGRRSRRHKLAKSRHLTPCSLWMLTMRTILTVVRQIAIVPLGDVEHSIDGALTVNDIADAEYDGCGDLELHRYSLAFNATVRPGSSAPSAPAWRRRRSHVPPLRAASQAQPAGVSRSRPPRRSLRRAPAPAAIGGDSTVATDTYPRGRGRCFTPRRVARELRRPRYTQINTHHARATQAIALESMSAASAYCDGTRPQLPLGRPGDRSD